MAGLLRNFFIFLLGLLIIAGVLSTLQFDRVKEEPLDVGTFIARVKEGQVTNIEVRGDELKVGLPDGVQAVVKKEPGESLSALLKNYGVEPDTLKNVKVEVKREGGFSYWASVTLPFLIPFILIGVLIMFMMRQVQGANSRAMSFGQAGARQAPPDAKEKVTFQDVAGLRESKEELEEIVEFLKNPKKFTAVGAKIPKGVLLMGAPGCGKTLLARAVAGEANVPFFHISGSEFVEMFVGVGAARVRDLFRKAKKSAPCILFIDEIDAVGRQRGAGLGGSHDEREQTLNQILVEMDGFDPHAGLIILAATNRPDILDPALLRPGRFDRRVMLDLPDIGEREEILKIHARGKPLSKAINLRTIAERTPGFSGADLANLMNEGALLTARRNKKEISIDELIESIEKVMLGPERKSRLLSAKERRVTAYHEGGHALVGHSLPGADPILPSEERHLKRRSEFFDEIAALLGGYVAEREVFGDLTTGASNDLRVATQLTRRLVTEYGMSDKLGPRTFGEREEMIFLGREITEQRDYSEKIAQMIDKEIDQIIRNAQARATAIIREKRALLDTIAKTLLKKETLEEKEFLALAGERPEPEKETASASEGTPGNIGSTAPPRKERGRRGIPQLGPVVV